MSFMYLSTEDLTSQMHIDDVTFRYQSNSKRSDCNSAADFVPIFEFVATVFFF